ncbi:MAG: DUF2691 family protein [Anaeroplasmataceae bacterium]|nr:DUF2691 family protein [Anaeroplasmataceae bacterium]
MKGLLLKCESNPAQVLSEMLSFLNNEEYSFNLVFVDLTADKEDEFFDVESFTSDMAKKMIFHPSLKRFIIALDLFVSKKQNYFDDVETFRDFLNSDYFLSLHIIDCSRIAIFCKNQSILAKIKLTFLQYSLENMSIKEIETVPLNTEMASYARNTSTCMWNI